MSFLVPAERPGHFSLTKSFSGAVDTIRHQTPGVQLAVGAGGGFLAGYMLGKTSKMIAVFVGTTLIVLQVAECQGYVKLHKRKLKADLEAVRERFGTLLDNGAEAIRSETGGQGITIDAGGVVVHRNSSGREFTRLVAQNARLLSGFFGGLLVGFGLA